MSRSVNKVILIGNLGKDPEIRYFEENRGVANFPLATTESYMDKSGERKDQTDWHNIVIYRPGLVGIAEKYLAKGKQVYLEGRLRTRSYEDAQQQTKYITEIIVDTLMLLGQAGGGENRPAPSKPAPDKPTAPEAPNAADGPDDDLPF
jgi:single-strand DNA-binding protein